MAFRSIFERLKNYKSNPIDEYCKISKYIGSVSFYGTSLTSFLKVSYLYCEAFRNVYPTLDELLEATCPTVRGYSSPAKAYYDSLRKETKDSLLEEFLTYCQVMLILIFAFRYKKIEIVNYVSAEAIQNETDYCINLISVSLKCFNYKFVKKEKIDEVEIILDDPVAESIASLSSSNISDSIMSYLGARDCKSKEDILNNFIDLLEPSLKKYSEQSLVKKTREYVQLLRHPEIKKNEKQYFWFFNNKKKYLDDVFTLCLFVQQYELSKKIINDFDNCKAKSESESL